MAFEHLLKTYNPDRPVLAPHTAEFAARLAANTSAAVSTTTTKLEISAMRAAVAETLAGKELQYPTGFSAESYQKENIGGMDCYVLKAENPASVPTLIMFYGGGFCLNTLFAHQAFMANVAAINSCNIILPDYPLAPESKEPEIMARSSQFLQAVLENSNALGCSDNLILMGWSSGAHMALSLALRLQQEAPKQFAKISQLILMSPWIDLSLNVARNGPYQAQQNSDTIAVGADVLEIMREWYLDDSYKHSLAELKNLPFTTVIAGGCEVLLGDAVFITDALQKAGTPVQLIILEGQTHNYLVFDELSRDGVYVPEVVGCIATKQSVGEMIGDDGFGITLIKIPHK